jgi:ribosome biogenesis protein YTM1
MDTSMTDAPGTHYGQVQVHFTTNSPDIELPEGKRQLLVPTSKYHILPIEALLT